MTIIVWPVCADDVHDNIFILNVYKGDFSCGDFSVSEVEDHGPVLVRANFYNSHADDLVSSVPLWRHALEAHIAEHDC
jgi:hypothetical protein